MTDPISADLKSLELLFEYTKFHISAYLTLAASFVTIASVKKGESFVLPVNRDLAVVALLLFMLAGLAGGVIVSSITQCYGIDMTTAPQKCMSTEALLKMPLGPWDGKVITLSGQCWVYLEHTSFWAGLAVAMSSFFVPSWRKGVESSEEPSPTAQAQSEPQVRGPSEDPPPAETKNAA